MIIHGKEEIGVHFICKGSKSLQLWLQFAFSFNIEPNPSHPLHAQQHAKFEAWAQKQKEAGVGGAGWQGWQRGHVRGGEGKPCQSIIYN